MIGLIQLSRFADDNNLKCKRTTDTKWWQKATRPLSRWAKIVKVMVILRIVFFFLIKTVIFDGGRGLRIVLKEYNPMTIPAKLGFIWPFGV